jgi:eukaryotic-like serine/threonine-protein kinase
MTYEPGQQLTLGGFSMTVQKLCGGSCAEVYLVEANDIGPATLKTISQLCPDERVGLLRHESQVLQQLSAVTNIVKLIGQGEHQGVPWMLMERLQSRHSFSEAPPNEKINQLAEICEALHCAHELGIVHRDIDPANILTDGKKWKLIDWGASYSSSSLAPAKEVLARYFTPSTAAPETFQGVVGNPRSDIYSIGCCFYHFLTKKMLYGEGSKQSLSNCHNNDPIPQLNDCPDEYQALLENLMAKEPVNRLMNMLQVKNRLLSLPPISGQ